MPSSTSSSDHRFVAAFTAVLVTAVLVLGVASEWLVRRHVVPIHPFTAYLELFRSSPARSAVFGDSYAAYGLSELPPGMVDLAYPGDAFYAIARKARLYFEQRTPDRVIIEAQPHHFSRAYVSWRDDADRFPDLLRQGGTGWFKAASPIHRPELFGTWSEFLRHGRLSARYPVAADGTRPGNDSFADRILSDRVAMFRRQALMRQPVPGFADGPVAALYRSLIVELIGRGARVCLLTFPVTDGLRQAEAGLEGYRGLLSWLDGLAVETGASRADLTGLTLPDDHFSDSDHLNRKGARMLTPEALARCFGPTSSQNRVEEQGGGRLSNENELPKRR